MSYTATKLMAASQIDIQQMELPDAVPEGHVRLKLATASLCGSDMHYYRHFGNAGFMLQNPVTLGHEACAYVVDANGNAFSEGQLLALNPIMFCGKCPSCQQGKVNLCTAKNFPGSATCIPHIDGFFREYFDFPAFCCHAVPQSMNPDHITFAEPISCAMHALNKGGVEAGSRVLVTGCGPMGLLAIVAAHARGAHVEATDVRPETVALAQQVGAKAGYLVDDEKLAAQANSFDVVVEASGAPMAFNQAIEMVRSEGKISILSIIQPSTTPINLHRITFKEIDVVGSVQYNSEFSDALELITSGTVDFEKLIAKRLPLQEAGKGFELMDSGSVAGKILFKP